MSEKKFDRMRALRPLATRDYRLLFAAVGIEVFGTGMWTIVMVFQVLALDDSPLALSAVATGMSLGLFAFSILGGVVADRFSKRRIIITVQGCTAVVTVTGVVEKTPKTSAGRRVVQLDDAAVGAFVAWQITQEADRVNCGTMWEGTDYVFTYENGEPLRPQYVTRLFDTLRKRAGLPKFTLHGMRHEHASLLIASGTDIALVSKRLGHSSLSITSDIYTHLIGDAGRRAAESASALIPRASAQQVHNEPSGAGMKKAPEPARSA